MNVTIINPQGKEFRLNMENSTPLHQMIKEYGVTSDTPIVAALWNGCYIRLNTIIDQDCVIALKDVRDAYGNMTLQYY